MAVGANVSDVARRNGILPQQLYAWRRQAKERMEAGHGMTFVPAMLAETPRPGATTLDAEIRIELCGMVVRVPEAASADHLERVLLAIQVAT
jgi:transposase